MSSATNSTPLVALLRRAHSPDSTSRIYAEKIQHKPLLLTPTATPRLSVDARAARRERREQKTKIKRRKPKPLSAAEKRRYCIYDISKTEAQYELYAGLNRMWHGYMREVLGLDRDRKNVVTAAADGIKLASADLHGAEMEVVKCSCVGRVGTKGIVVRETKYTVMIVTKKNQVKTVPKEGSMFRLEVQVEDEHNESEHDDKQQLQWAKPLVFELNGDLLRNRPPDRAMRKWKPHFDLES